MLGRCRPRQCSSPHEFPLSVYPSVRNLCFRALYQTLISSPPTLRRSTHNNHRHIASTETEASTSTTMPTLPTLLQRFYPPSHTVSQEYVDQTTHPTSPVINPTLLQPSSVYQPRDKHDQKGSPDRSSRPKTSVRLLRREERSPLYRCFTAV